MPRFFVLPDHISESVIKIGKEDAPHISRSLRMAVGDELTVSDGCGNEYLTRLTRIRDEECECEIIEKRRSLAEPAVEVTLLMAYPKGDKLETVIQKAVELGVYRIIPFESSRCIKRPKAEKAEKQLARLCRIAEEAAKQCGRAILPKVLAPISFTEAVKVACESELALLCYEGESATTVKAVLEESSPRSISVMVGSEGGFSPEEAAEACAKGMRSVTLGRRILRCETAPLYALTAISYRFEL